VDEWKLFKQMWQNYTIVAKLNIQTDEYQRALFLHTIGPEALTLYNAKDLPNLHQGDTVRMKPFKLGVKSWKKAKVLGRLDERSYEVEDSDGTVYRRNRVHLRKTHE
ncbi:hypothetical protein LSAT2_022263, partial [Lamellibrachia satsuma]